MKIFTCLNIMLAILALAATLPAQTPTSNPSEAEAQVKLELDEAARAFREGNFAAAQAHSEKALLLDPQNKLAPHFVARTIHAQYKPGDFTLENVEKARLAISAYQRILERSPHDDEPYKAVAYLYGAIKDDERLRQWVFQRAHDVSVANDKRAEAFVVLASKDWDCSFSFTEQPDVKVTTVVRNKAQVKFRMPNARVQFEQARDCANRGLENASMAITLAPENESAWSYKTNLLLELSKLAEMAGDLQRKSELLRQYDEALKETTRLTQRSQSNP